jgi:cobalt-zinc-cadmium efflux system membrane fusion protein
MTGKPLSLALAVIAIAAIATGCSPKDDKSDAASVTASNVKLTDDQLKHIRIYTVASTNWRKSVDATGAVDFDNDQATSVLAPFSGPVTRLLVTPGEKVRKDQPLATRTS